ncbi:MAG: hypothetical protein HYT68_01275 [Candidatus Zambryskibacteria bacterium]|nr:hypothetical protein [Candidatus Zambryskibacteria bacterium]
MAEEKKATSTVSNKEVFEQIVFLLAGLVLLAAIVNGLLNYFDSLSLGTSDTFWTRLADSFLESIWPIWKIAAVIVSALALVGIIYNSRKLSAINAEEKKIFNPVPEAAIQWGGEVVEPKNERWEKIIEHANSNNASDWRSAIIEADVMLEELLRKLGYQGESVGDMLKSVDKSDFLTLEDAWGAHKIRNKIAHSGSGFQLNERETKRVVALFERVFKEFGVI